MFVAMMRIAIQSCWWLPPRATMDQRHRDRSIVETPYKQWTVRFSPPPSVHAQQHHPPFFLTSHAPPPPCTHPTMLHQQGAKSKVQDAQVGRQETPSSLTSKRKLRSSLEEEGGGCTADTQWAKDYTASYQTYCNNYG